MGVGWRWNSYPQSHPSIQHLPKRAAPLAVGKAGGPHTPDHTLTLPRTHTHKHKVTFNEPEKRVNSNRTPPRTESPSSPRETGGPCTPGHAHNRHLPSPAPRPPPSTPKGNPQAYRRHGWNSHPESDALTAHLPERVARSTLLKGRNSSLKSAECDVYTTNMKNGDRKITQVQKKRPEGP